MTRNSFLFWWLKTLKNIFSLRGYREFTALGWSLLKKESPLYHAVSLIVSLMTAFWVISAADPTRLLILIFILAYLLGYFCEEAIDDGHFYYWLFSNLEVVCLSIFIRTIFLLFGI